MHINRDSLFPTLLSTLREISASCPSFSFDEGILGLGWQQICPFLSCLSSSWHPSLKYLVCNLVSSINHVAA
ncbi:hypothetical protein RJT34_17407 [Clitoria ternatea]|uniref:Uncharacterized protein n=1 Tax=Clitoria ternatea TaxID=43366 RepID=A0AAN9J9B2_CLITE